MSGERQSDPCPICGSRIVSEKWLQLGWAYEGYCRRCQHKWTPPSPASLAVLVARQGKDKQR